MRERERERERGLPHRQRRMATEPTYRGPYFIFGGTVPLSTNMAQRLSHSVTSRLLEPHAPALTRPSPLSSNSIERRRE